jgi:AcrR family transcriptional regulator
MPSTLRERRKQMLRDEILDAARLLIGEKGYAAVSMDELAAQAGISKPTLYSYFDTKEALVVATITREFDRLFELINADLNGESPLQRLCFILRTIVFLHAERRGKALRPFEPELFQMLCSHQDAVSRMRGLDEAVLRLVQAGMARGEIDPMLKPLAVVRGFYALANSLRFAAQLDATPPDPDEYADTLVAMFERGIRGYV